MLSHLSHKSGIGIGSVGLINDDQARRGRQDAIHRGCVEQIAGGIVGISQKNNRGAMLVDSLLY